MHEVLKNHILHLLQKDSTPRKLVHLEQELGIRGELKAAFREALDSLCAEGSVIVGAGNLVRLVLSRDAWQSYSPSETKVGFHDHPDPDARWENVSWYMPRSEFPGRIRQALQAGFPVIVSIQNHGVLLYGADYDSNGSPITYYIKDSYNTLRIIGGSLAWDYYYLSGADLLHVNLWEMTTVKL